MPLWILARCSGFVEFFGSMSTILDFNLIYSLCTRLFALCGEGLIAIIYAQVLFAWVLWLRRRCWSCLQQLLD